MEVGRMNEWTLLSCTRQFPFFKCVNLVLLYRFQAPTGGSLIFYFFRVLLYSLPKPKLNIQSELKKKQKHVINCYWNASGKWESISRERFHFLASPWRGQKDKKLPMLQSHAVPVLGRWMKVLVLGCKILLCWRWQWTLKDQRATFSPFLESLLLLITHVDFLPHPHPDYVALHSVSGSHWV